jgi:RNA polymerase sigma-70 factor (ECF subfamily)
LQSGGDVANIGLHLESCVGSRDLAGGLRTDEADLVEGLRLGVERAYEELLVRYQQPVYNLVYRLLSDPADANDVVQEVFLKVFRNIGLFRSQSSLKTWIYRIAVNEAHNHRRWFSRHRRQEVGLDRDDDDRSYQDTLSDPGKSPFDEAASHEAHAIVEAALNGLNPTFRTAVVLRDIEDLSYDEIAEILQINLGTVKSRIMRGREALKQTLLARLSEPPASKAAGITLTPQLAE